MLGIKLFFKLFLIFLVFVVAIIYLGQGLDKASLEKFELTGVSNINSESFTILGELHVHNPSNLSVPIDSITYDVYLKDSGSKLGDGTIEKFILAKSSTTLIPFSHNVKWSDLIGFLTDVLNENDAIVVVRGALHIDIPKVKEYAIPFAQEMDLKDHISPYLNDNPVSSILNLNSE